MYIVVVIFIISFSLSAAFSASSQFFIISSIIFSSIIFSIIFSISNLLIARVKLILSDRKQFQRGALGLKLLSYFQNWNCAKQNISCFETINIFVYFCWGCNCYLTSKIKITQSWIYPVLKQPRLKKELYHGRVNVLWRNIFPVFPHRRLLEK